MSLARAPQLGSKPVSLTVKVKPGKMEESLLESSMQELYRRGEFTDVVLRCAEQSYPAHRVVLAAVSPVLKQGFLSNPEPGPGQRSEIRLEVANPEAVKIMLNFCYHLDSQDWADFNPRTQAVNRDVLLLAKQFELPDLTQQAMFWLGRDLTTANVVERLAICDEFGLVDLSEKILQQLTNNREALADVAHSPQIMNHPKLMQLMLQSAAGPQEPECPQPKGKKARRALCA